MALNPIEQEEVFIEKGCIFSTSVFDWGFISILMGWGCIQGDRV